jgi:ribose 5-phosphate isomerase A
MSPPGAPSDYVEDGMRVGLGTGSTAVWMVRCLGEMVREEGMMITTVATSRRTAELARSVGLDVRPLDDVRWLDLTIDGADEFDPGLNLIKGGGGALLHEKIVATASDQMVVIADRSNTSTGWAPSRCRWRSCPSAGRPPRRWSRKC